MEDLKAFKVNKLHRDYCIDQLMENLAVEQPGIHQNYQYYRVIVLKIFDLFKMFYKYFENIFIKLRN